MSELSRRNFIKIAGTAGVASAVGTLGWPLSVLAKGGKAGGRVIVIGGGFGGATCAKYIRRFGPGIEVTLIEPSTKFVTCPFSNAVLGGLQNMNSITQGYGALRDKHGVKVVHDTVTAVDPGAKKVTLRSGKKLAYDRLVVSPGIDFRWEKIEGYDAQVSKTIPHAWKGGPQTVALSKQLRAMKNGGVVIIAPPGNPFRCPPGPYERASMIAHYLKYNKPKSKILILDVKNKFSKQPLFMQGWKKLYPGMIEWIAGYGTGGVARVAAKTRTVYDAFGKAYRGDVINIIPPQKANKIAYTAGLVNRDGWCPVNQRTFESTIHKDIHVIGDASIAGKLPKSGFAASSEAKVCAAAIVSALSGKTMPEPSYVNTCYSLIAPDYGISVAMVYRVTGEGISKIKGAGGISPKDADKEFRRKEAEYARGWYASITSDTWG